MELLTDILAIAGWALFGFIFPNLFLVFDRSEGEFRALTNMACALSFGLIAASLVLG